MASLNQQQLNWYRQSIAHQASEAARGVIDSIDLKSNNISSIREQTINAIKSALSVYGDNAQVVAGQMFDYIMNAEGNINAVYKFFPDLIDDDMVYKKIHYYTSEYERNLYDNALNLETNNTKYKKQIADYTKSLVKRCAHDGIAKNCKENKVYYALVPTGFETCAFCFMLASRGFVYSEKTADKWTGGGFHRNCDCVLLPSSSGKLDVYGYDPDALYENYQEAMENRDSYGSSRNANDAVKAIDNLAKEKGWDYLWGN